MDVIEIIFRDDHLLAVNKPAGLLSVPGIGDANKECLITRVQREFPTAQIVHRLDRATSGVIIVALDAGTHRELSRLFRERNVKKTYIAIVAGIVEPDEGEIDLPLRKDLEESKRIATPFHIIDRQFGKGAQSKWRVIDRSAPLGSCVQSQSFWRDRAHPPAEPGANGLATSRLELTPFTGRSHQLRVHLNAICHPMLGDDIYAPSEVRDAAPRLMLHAESLELDHPWSAKLLRFNAPSPF